jgi:hypothetical protein
VKAFAHSAKLAAVLCQLSLAVVPVALAGGFVAGPNGAVAVGPKGGAVAVRAPPPPYRPPAVVVVRPPPPPPVVVVVRPPTPAVVVVAAPAAGTIVVKLPPVCTSLSVGGIHYQNCGGVYYRAQFQGPQLVYAVVPRP